MTDPIHYKETLKMTNNNLDSALELMQLLAKDLEESIPQWKESLIKQDWLAFGRVAHRLLGATAYCSAPKINQLSSQLNREVKSNPTLETIQPIVENLIEEANQVIRYVKEHLASS